jgi:CheY-like chemotaxis protein
MSDKTIFLVEDNPHDEELALLALARNGFSHRVVVARDGVEALDLLFRLAAEREGGAEPTPSLVLLDLKLPKVDGFEVLRRLRAHPRAKLLPVVVLTSSREEQDVTRAYSLGANSYIRKSVDFEQFVEAIGQIGQYWLHLNEPPPTLSLRP